MRTEKCSPRTGIIVATADLEKENFGLVQGKKAGLKDVQENVGGSIGGESKYLFQNFILKKKWGGYNRRSR